MRQTLARMGNNRCEYILGRKINRAVSISCMEARGVGINFTKISDAQEDEWKG